MHCLRDIAGNLLTNLRYKCSFNNSFSNVCHFGGITGTRYNITQTNNHILKQYSEAWGFKLTADPLGYTTWIRPGPNQYNKGPFPVKKKGYDPATSTWTEFMSTKPWFRDHYISKHGGTRPRERALAFVLANMFPNWFMVEKIHESSPDYRGH